MRLELTRYNIFLTRILDGYSLDSLKSHAKSSSLVAEWIILSILIGLFSKFTLNV